MMLNSVSVTVANPSTEPVSLEEARKQVELAADDDSHDAHLSTLIEVAREMVEHDTGSLVVSRTVTEKFADFYHDYICLRFNPTAVTSIAYYDSANTSQTYSASYYSLDGDRRKIWLLSTATWPTVYDRWDAVTVTYTAGYSRIPATLKQAMLLQIGYGFENRDMLKNEATYNRSAYDALINRYRRSSYP